MEDITGKVGNLPRGPRIKPTVANKSFPYRDEYEDLTYSEDELDLAYRVKEKIGHQHTVSSNLTAKDSGTEIEVFKISEIAKGLSPYPRMYKKRTGHLGNSAKSISNAQSAGFYMGSSISGHTYSKERKEDKSEEPVYGLEDLAIKQLKEYIRIVIMEVS
tara:strand:+ start:13427 stop:13906 length:480 start_codon:yes stop_codon:yes gene_type:complete